MRPAAKDGWPPSRKLFGSLGCVLCLLTRAHPGLSYCPYKTAQEGRKPNVLNVPGRKMLTMNPCGGTVQCNCKSTQHSPWRATEENAAATQVASGFPLSFCSSPTRAGPPPPPLCHRIWEMGSLVAIIRESLNFQNFPNQKNLHINTVYF